LLLPKNLAKLLELIYDSGNQYQENMIEKKYLEKVSVVAWHPICEFSGVAFSY